MQGRRPPLARTQGAGLARAGAEAPPGADLLDEPFELVEFDLAGAVGVDGVEDFAELLLRARKAEARHRVAQLAKRDRA